MRDWRETVTKTGKLISSAFQISYSTDFAQRDSSFLHQNAIESDVSNQIHTDVLASKPTESEGSELTLLTVEE